MTTLSIAEICQELAACRRRLEGLPVQSRLARNLARLVSRLGDRLIRPPRVVLLGEFNSGKSTLANALIGAEVLPTSIHANTRVPILVHYSDKPSMSLECRDHSRRALSETTLRLLGTGQAHMLHVGLPVDLLKTYEVIDTPGLASGVIRHDELVVEACRRANIAVWCTASTQAWKASEQAAWMALPQRLRQRGLLVSTMADALNCDRDNERLTERLGLEASHQFAGVALISARKADETRRQRSAPDYTARWVECGGKALEDLLQGLIDRELDDRGAAAERILARSAERLAASGLFRAEAA